MNCFIFLLRDNAFVKTYNGVSWHFSFNMLNYPSFYPVIILSMLLILLFGDYWRISWRLLSPFVSDCCLFWFDVIIAINSCYIFLSFLFSSSLNFFIKLLFSSISLWFCRSKCLQICYRSFCLVFIYWIWRERELLAWP